MDSAETLRPSPDKPLSRQSLVNLVLTALSVGENRYARFTALAWLAYYPGDLPVNLLHARALVQEGLSGQALPILENLCQADPEYLEAQELLVAVSKSLNRQVAIEAEGCILALGGTPSNRAGLPKWATFLRAARRAAQLADRSDDLETKASEVEFNKVEGLIHQALLENPSTPLAALNHLTQMTARHNLTLSVLSLAQSYHERWPICLQFQLVLADVLMSSGAEDQAVSLLHQAAARDVTGQVANRMWGLAHRYQVLWPETLQVQPDSLATPQQIPIPAAVTAALGWNQLPVNTLFTEPAEAPDIEYAEPVPDIAPETPAEATVPTNRTEETNVANQPHFVLELLPLPESQRSLQADLEEVARNLKQPALARMDGRYPLYIIFTTRQGLISQYGEANASLIDREMVGLAGAIGRRKRWGAIVYFADEAVLEPAHPSIKLKPARYTDPWELKLALCDLDEALRKRGERIGALLIVGGPEVVPFHNLPNPVDDFDADVSSDNPYATRDENYFIPEWPVGRIPGGSGKDPQPLLSSLKRMAANHTDLAQSGPWHQRWWNAIQKALQRLFSGSKERPSSYGYSAAIWRRASLSVFHPIGDPRLLIVSPPVQIGLDCPSEWNSGSKAPCLQLPPARLGYFNLHGLPDTEEWFGQRDPTEPGDDPDFPMALRPVDIGTNGVHGSASRNCVPEVVFSEACYGANILNKTIDQAIVLKLIASGTLAVVGSTCTSYGSITTPLIAADLLGRAFWHYLREGHPAGEALRRAKIYLAREMHRRQGYLDGEDQKTLISFVLYGDPLAQLGGSPLTPKIVLRPANTPSAVQTVCDRSDEAVASESIPPEILAQVKQVVSQYLPGMVDAQIRYTREHARCISAGHRCPTAQLGAKASPARQPDRQVVTLSKNFARAALVHRQYARLTLDARGKLVKLVVSR